MIIAPLDAIFLSCTQAITTFPFGYRSAKLWELNEEDSPTTQECLWALPFEYRDTYDKMGFRITRMVVQLFFLRNNYLYEKQATKTVIVDDMHEAFKLWRTAFEASSIFPTIHSYRIVDVYNDFDANRSGISVWIDFEFRNTIC